MLRALSGARCRQRLRCRAMPRYADAMATIARGYARYAAFADMMLPAAMPRATAQMMPACCRCAMPSAKRREHGHWRISFSQQHPPSPEHLPPPTNTRWLPSNRFNLCSTPCPGGGWGVRFKHATQFFPPVQCGLGTVHPEGTQTVLPHG